MKPRITVSVRLIEGNTVHWYGIRGDVRFDYSTWVKEISDEPMQDVIRAEGGTEEFKQLLISNFNYREAEMAASSEIAPKHAKIINLKEKPSI